MTGREHTEPNEAVSHPGEEEASLIPGKPHTGGRWCLNPLNRRLPSRGLVTETECHLRMCSCWLTAAPWRGQCRSLSGWAPGLTGRVPCVLVPSAQGQEKLPALEGSSARGFVQGRRRREMGPTPSLPGSFEGHTCQDALLAQVHPASENTFRLHPGIPLTLPCSVLCIGEGAKSLILGDQ